MYGVELGAYSAMRAANRDENVNVLVLDSVPRSPDELVNAAVSENISLDSKVLSGLARAGTRVYFLGKHDNKTSCELVATLRNQRIMLLAGADDGYLRTSTKSLEHCFPNSDNLEAKIDLPLTGFTMPSATGEQGEGYDRPVIDFFVKNLH